jgi:hypothetical protein
MNTVNDIKLSLYFSVANRMQAIFGERYKKMTHPKIFLMDYMTKGFYCYKCLASMTTPMYAREDRIRGMCSVKPLHGRFVQQITACVHCGETKECVKLIGWQAVGPNLTDELKALDFMVMTGRIAAQVESAGNKIYQRL